MKKVIRMTPDQLGYKDRGMMKWQGLMLSDHLEAIKQQEKKDALAEPAPKEKMSLEDISEVLYLAYFYNNPVIIQANVVTNGHYYQDLKCIVLGYVEEKIYLQLKDGRRTSCVISQIRNIKLMNPMEWFNKM